MVGGALLSLLAFPLRDRLHAGPETILERRVVLEPRTYYSRKYFFAGFTRSGDSSEETPIHFGGRLGYRGISLKGFGNYYMKDSVNEFGSHLEYETPIYKYLFGSVGYGFYSYNIQDERDYTQEIRFATGFRIPSNENQKPESQPVESSEKEKSENELEKPRIFHDESYGPRSMTEFGIQTTYDFDKGTGMFTELYLMYMGQTKSTYPFIKVALWHNHKYFYDDSRISHFQFSVGVPIRLSRYFILTNQLGWQIPLHEDFTDRGYLGLGLGFMF